MAIDGWTIALQAINFLVLVWLLWRLLYRPVLAVIARRKALVEKAFSEAEEAKRSAEVALEGYEADQAALQQSRQDLLSRAHAEIEADRERVLEEANVQAEVLLQRAREQIEAERAAALEDARAQVADLAVEMATTLLKQITGQSSTASRLNDAFLAHLTTRLDALSADELRSLKRELEADREGLRVVTARPLNPEEQGRWQRALQDRIGPARRLEFVVETELVGGAELRFPHAVLSVAWSELLQRGREALLAHEVSH